MKNNLKIKETESFVLQYDSSLEQFIEKSLEIANKKLPTIENLFNCNRNEIGKIKASFFTKREDFVSYIQSITNGHTPPAWASGCFYNNEIQTLLDIYSSQKMEYKTHTLTHEYTHLVIDKQIYQKYNIQRIRWFDESFANYLDGSQDSYSAETIKILCDRLKNLSEFDLNILNDINKTVTDSYNGYDMFILVGRYIFENNLQTQIIKILSENGDTVVENGKTMLSNALKYFKEKYNF